MKLLGLVAASTALLTISALAQSSPPAKRDPLAALAAIAAHGAAACPTISGHGTLTGKHASRCEGTSSFLCPTYVASDLRSNLCVNERLNLGVVTDAHGRSVDYSLFGKLDCRAYPQVRELRAIDRVVVRGGAASAQRGVEEAQCLASAPHYAIDRDGKIFQIMGEERVAPTLRSPGDRTNPRAIGVDLAGASDEHAPTGEQRESLKRLLRGIATRTSVVLDEEHVVAPNRVKIALRDAR